MTRRKRRIIGWVTTVACGVAFAVGLTWITAPFRVDRGGQAARDPATVAKHDDRRPRGPEFIGVVVSRAAIDLSPRIDGKLEAVLVKVGQTVAANQVVARLESMPIRQDLQLARATLKGVRAGASHAQIAMLEARERSKRRLAVADELSKEEVASAKSQARLGGAGLSVAQAAVAEQQARIAKLEETLAYTEVRAPFAGKVAAVYTVVGAMVGSKTALLRVVQNQDLCVRFAVPAKQVSQITVGKAVRFALETAQGELPGRVENVSPEVDPGSQMGYVEATLDLPNDVKAKIQPGLVAKVRLLEDTRVDDDHHAWQEAHP